MGDNLGLPWWVLCSPNRPYQRVKGGVKAGGEGDVLMEAGTGVICFGSEGRGHKPSNIGGHEVEKGKETDFSFRVSRGTGLSNTFILA